MLACRLKLRYPIRRSKDLRARLELKDLYFEVDQYFFIDFQMNRALHMVNGGLLLRGW